MQTLTKSPREAKLEFLLLHHPEKERMVLEPV
jgi:hypothetical protein